MKLFMVHVGYYDKSIGEGLYETHLNYFVAAEDAKDAKNKAHQITEFQERSMHIDGMKEISSVDVYKRQHLLWALSLKYLEDQQSLLDLLLLFH